MARANAKARTVKPTGTMAAIAASRKTPTVLLGDVQKHVLAKAQKNDRRVDVIHPSEMAKEDWCPRQTYYRIANAKGLHDVPDPVGGRAFSFQMETIFQEGHDVHHKWQTWLAEMGRLYGRWEHRQSGLAEFTTLSADDYRTGEWVYREVSLRDDDLNISGHADGGIEDLGAVLEVKTIGLGTLRMEEPSLVSKYTVKTEDGTWITDVDALWKGIRRPLQSHLRQTNIYLWLCKVMGLPFDKVVFIYENKANQSVKEFTVSANPDLVEPLLDTAKDINHALDKGITPPRPEHTGKDIKVCKECPWLQHCYGGSDGTSDQADEGPDPAPRRRKPARQAGDREAGAAPARTTTSRRAGSARGSDRPGRLRADGAVRSAQSVDGLPGDATGSRRGGRKIRRRNPGDAQG